jgi:serine/threonine protein kinase/Tfp pilus assembly protein PilF
MDDQERARLAAGAVLDDRYRLDAEIGNGLTGIVYRGTHLLMRRPVAIKMLTHEKANDSASRQRFQNEAKAISLLNHPAIVKIHDFGFSPQGDPYLVMDLIEGVSLARALEDKGKLSVYDALKVSCEIADALAHAHQKGVIHRDIKPNNILLLPGPAAMLVDFGIAKLARSDGSPGQALTQTGETFASPTYMSPEQCLGRQLDARSDIYSFGCVLYEALAGHPPFTGATPIEIVSQHISRDAAPLSLDCPDEKLAVQLSDLVKRAMQKSPEKRFSSMAELKLALTKVAGAGASETDNAVKEQSKRTPQGFPVPAFHVIWPTGLALLVVLLAAALVWLGSPSGQLALALNTLSIQEFYLSSNNRRLLETKLKIVSIYEQQNDFKAAAAMCERMLPDIRQISGSLTPAVAETLEHLGDLYKKSGDHTRANQRYIEALNILDKLYFKIDQSKRTNAFRISMLQQELRIAQKTEGFTDPSSAQLEASIASLYHQELQVEQAEKYYKDAIAHLATTLGAGRQKTWVVCQDYLGRLYRDNGRLKEAEPWLKKAIEHATELWGLGSHDTQTFVLDLIVTYQLERNWEQQVRFIKSVLPALQLADSSEFSPAVAVAVERQNDAAILERYLGVAYGKLNKSQLAEAALKRAIALSTATGNLKDKVTEQCLLGHQYLVSRELQKAKREYEPAIALFERARLPILEQANMLDGYRQLLELLGDKEKTEAVSAKIKRLRAAS